MNKLNYLTRLFLFFPLLSIILLVEAQEQNAPTVFIMIGSGQRYTETIPVIDIRNFGYQATQLVDSDPASVNDQSAVAPLPSVQWGGGSDPNNPYAAIRKRGPVHAQPGAVARYEIILSNYESVTRTYQLTDILPVELTYVLGSASDDGLLYDPVARALSWQGELPPGRLDYLIEENGVSLPYLDLAAFGAPNLCDAFIADGGPCKDTAVTFNLGVNGYTAVFYGESLSQLTVSSNGFVFAEETDTAVDAPPSRNQWLPDGEPPNFLLAGLWRAVDMDGADADGLPAANGRWHAAIVAGLIEEHDVFYAQWHDAPVAADSNLTARHAVAIVLNRTTSATQGDATEAFLAGHAFFIYDNISDSAQTVAQGYTVGIEDKRGERGVVYAYAPSGDDPHPPQGYPPTAGTTLHLRPVLFGAGDGYSRAFSYEAVVGGDIPQTIATTAVAISSSPDPALAVVWSTHYLHLRWQSYLPLLIRRGE